VRLTVRRQDRHGHRGEKGVWYVGTRRAYVPVGMRREKLSTFRTITNYTIKQYCDVTNHSNTIGTRNSFCRLMGRLFVQGRIHSFYGGGFLLSSYTVIYKVRDEKNKSRTSNCKRSSNAMTGTFLN